MVIKKRTAKKTSKGYRLKDSTHSLIEKIQLLINASKDAVISRAVKLYHIQIRNSDKGVLKTNSKTLK